MDVTEYASSVVYGEEGLLEGLEDVKEEAPSKRSSSFAKKSTLGSQFNNSATTLRSSSFAQERSSDRRRDEQSSILVKAWFRSGQSDDRLAERSPTVP